MTIREMVERVNKLTGQGIYNVNDLLPYFDECIDEINDILNINLPPVSDIYNNSFEKNEQEEGLTYVSPGYKEGDHEAEDNDYRRLPNHYIRNYVCYETSFRILRDEDEAEEVYMARATHAQNWLRKIVANEGEYRMSVGDTILVNADVKDDGPDPEYYNPYWLYEGEDK